jgi:hypothetical protein
MGTLALAGGLLFTAACASSSSSPPPSSTPAPTSPAPNRARASAITPAAVAAVKPNPDPRVGLKAGLTDAGEAIWNMRKLSSTQPPSEFVGSTNSDLAFRDNMIFGPH